MSKRFVDLSVPIRETLEGEIREDLKATLTPEIDYHTHEETDKVMMNIFGCEKEDLPEGLGWANESIKLTTHTGTHLDAPYHYYPTVNGERAKTIDELPLDWFYGDGVVLDLTFKKDYDEVSVEDVKHVLSEMNYNLKEGDIVFLRFDADKKYGKPEYWTNFPGMSAEATHWIVDKGVKVIGTDAMGFDIPFEKIAEKFKRTGNPEDIWSAHRVGIEKEYCQIEKVANLDQLPSQGFTVTCFPIPIENASAGWVRPVAILNNDK